MEKGFELYQALAEAERCLLCHDAPCSKGCPAGTDPATFIRKLRLKNITGAIRTIKENNILGGACGALCPTSRLCEKECSACGIDRPIKIGRLQRFLVEHGWKLGFRLSSEKHRTKQKIAVVGAGPAGLSCAAELAKGGYPVTVFEERSGAGGVLRYGVPEHRFSKNFLNMELEDVKNLGVEFKFSRPIKDSGAIDKLLAEGYSAVFLATGLWKPIELKNLQKNIEGLFSATDFLSVLKVSGSDSLERFLKGKCVAVIGGGSVAMDCAESAMKFGARDVHLVYRRSYAQMPAEGEEKIAALNLGVNFLLLNQPIGLVSDSNNRLTGLKLVRTQLGEVDASGRRSPKNIDGSEWVLDVDTVVVAIGSEPDSESPSWYPSVKVSKDKLILAEENTCQTSVENVFAGGDITRGPDLIVNAVKDGKNAAKAIKKYLSEREVGNE